MFNTRRMAVIAVFVALATVLNIVERSVLVPGLPPGVKPGLANVMTLLSILTLGFRDAFFIVAVRCFMGALIAGNRSASYLVSLAVCSAPWSWL